MSVVEISNMPGAAMALINCPECQREISDKAVACPHCGIPLGAPLAPAPAQKKKGKGCLPIFIVFGVIALIAIATSEKKDESGEKKDQPTPVKSACVTDWHKCTDNADLANNFSEYYRAKSACKIEAENRAKYGSPKWPWFAFGSLRVGDSAPKTGVITIVENDAQFSNAFNAMVHSTVTCRYDLNSGTVLNVTIVAN